MQRITAIADEQWIGVLQRLTQFGSRPETIGMDVEAVKNLAGLMGGDVQSAAQAYSKAMQGQFEMFGRLGIQVDQNLSQFEKLRQLQEELASKGGGQLEARAKTLAGQFQSVKNSVSDFFESIGRLIARTGVIQGNLSVLSGLLNLLGRAIGGAIDPVDGLTNAVKGSAEQMEDAERAAGTLKDGLNDLKQEATDSAKAFDSLKDSIDDALRTDTKLLDLERKKALSTLNRRREAGEIDEPAFLAEKHRIELEFINKKAEAEKVATEKKLAGIQMEMDAIEEQRAEANAVLKTEEAALVDVTQRDKRAKELRSEAAKLKAASAGLGPESFALSVAKRVALEAEADRIAPAGLLQSQIARTDRARQVAATVESAATPRLTLLYGAQQRLTSGLGVLGVETGVNRQVAGDEFAMGQAQAAERKGREMENVRKAFVSDMTRMINGENVVWELKSLGEVLERANNLTIREVRALKDTQVRFELQMRDMANR